MKRIAAFVLFAALPFLCWGQAFPAKPVRIVVPTAPGGGMDSTARVVGGKLQGYWGQSVLVENRPGAAMIIGAEAAAKSAPDGYTLLVAHDGDRFQERASTARKYLKDFGVGAFCGFGRIPPAELPRVLREHQQAISALGA